MPNSMPERVCNLKIPNQLHLDFPGASWYSSCKPGVAQDRRIQWLGWFLVADDSPTIQKRALGILKGEGV